MKFENTELLDHPTVRKAYQVMRGFFSKGDSFAKQAVRTGEILSKCAKNPDPDAIAACVLIDGMIIPYTADSFEQTVSKQAAAYVQFCYDLDTKNPVYTTEGERQILLAHAILGLEDVYQEIMDKHVWKYQEMKDKIDLNEINITAVASGTAEQDLVRTALDRLDKAKTALEDLVRTTQEKFVFENTGLPDHPTIRGAYELIRASESMTDPLFTGYTQAGLDAAKLLLETGASSDPDVIGAVLLNQYWERTPGTLIQKFSPRLAELHDESSAWNRRETTKEPSEEARIIKEAVLTRTVEEYIEYKGRLEYTQLENIELYSKSIETLAQSETRTGLKVRMEKAVAAANKLLHAPKNEKTRKPGTPRRNSADNF